MKIGFIGLGHMGNPMVCNVLQAGYQCRVFDLDSEAVQRLVDQGAVAVPDLATLARDSDVVVSMLQSGEQVRAITGGEKGLFSHLTKGALYIDSSTIDIVTAKDIHQQALSKGIMMVDAPVSGGVAGAEKGALTFMVGGEMAAYSASLPILQCMGKNIFHAGSAGAGQAVKACNNMILGISMIAVSEGFNLARKLGLNTKTFFDISSTASGQCWSMTSYCPEPGMVDSAPSNHDYLPGFSANMMLKDLLLSQDAAKQVEVNTPLGNAAMQMYKEFVDKGNGEMDFSAIIKMLKRD